MSTVDTATKAPAANGAGPEKPFVIVDLGRRSRKQIKRLRRGEGRLMERVDQTLDQLRTEGEISAESEVVVFVVKEKEDRKGLFF